MLKALLKVNAAAFVNWLAGSGKRGNKGKSSKGKMIVYALLMLYALGCSAGCSVKFSPCSLRRFITQAAVGCILCMCSSWRLP